MNESSSFMNVIFNYCSPNLWKCSSQQCGRIRPAGGSSATGYPGPVGPCRGGLARAVSGARGMRRGHVSALVVWCGSVSLY